MKHLLSIADLNRTEIEDLLDLADQFGEVLDRDIPKVPTLRGATVATLFFEASTRTRLSFERAAKALSADVMTFAPGTSSVTKGESLKDTALTVRAMGADLLVVRHEAAGAAARVASWVDCPVVNAGDGAHQHPTQALLDCPHHPAAFRQAREPSVGIVGDIRNSRVARSNIDAFTALGASVTLIGPPTLLPTDTSELPAQTAHDLDDVLPELDVLYLLRVQLERGADPCFLRFTSMSNASESIAVGSTLMSPEAVVMHPGPMNRGVEISPTSPTIPGR